MKIEIDPDYLDDAARAAVEAAIEREFDARAEQRAQDARDRDSRDDRMDATRRAERAAEVRAAATLARSRAAAAVEQIGQHAKRSADPRLSPQEKAAEESLVVSAYRSAQSWRAIENEARRASLSVSEPAPYHRGGTHSFFLDRLAFAQPAHADHRAATERLERWGKGLARGIDGDSLRARKVWREASRKDDDLRDASAAEYRAMSSGSASGGAFVVPGYAVEDAALYRSAPAAVLNFMTTPRPLPDHGMTVYVPKFTAAGNVQGQGSENSAPTQSDPAAQYQSAPVTSYYGYVNASQQLVDRTAGEFDAAIYAQLLDQLDAVVGSAVIAQILSNAPSPITRTSASLTLAQFLADIGKAAASLETTTGTRLIPTGIAAPATTAEWLLSQTTSGGDSWFKPSLGGMRTQQGQTGQAVSGIELLIDDNLPAASSNAQLLVASKIATNVYSGEPIFDVLQAGGLAGQLTSVFRIRQYVAAVTKHSAGTIIITGSGYPTAPAFA